MKVAVLFSGGKDSSLAAFLARREGYEIGCLISIFSENKESFMFHVPSVEKTKVQAEMMGLPIVLKKTLGEKELELEDLKEVIIEAREEYGIEGVVTGAVESVYQATRVQKICFELGLECFNPLWQKDQVEILRDLIKERFKVIVTGVAAYPLDEEFLGRVIDEKFIDEMVAFRDKFGISVAGEGGEFESFVMDCPMFEKEIEVKGFEDFGEGNCWRRELEI